MHASLLSPTPSLSSDGDKPGHRQALQMGASQHPNGLLHSDIDGKKEGDSTLHPKQRRDRPGHIQSRRAFLNQAIWIQNQVLGHSTSFRFVNFKLENSTVTKIATTLSRLPSPLLQVMQSRFREIQRFANGKARTGRDSKSSCGFPGQWYPLSPGTFTTSHSVLIVLTYRQENHKGAMTSPWWPTSIRWVRLHS